MKTTNRVEREEGDEEEGRKARKPSYQPGMKEALYEPNTEKTTQLGLKFIQQLHLIVFLHPLPPLSGLEKGASPKTAQGLKISG